MKRLLCLLATSVLLSSSPALAQIFDSSGTDERRPDIMWNIQAGIHARIGGDSYSQNSAKIMGTVDLSWLRWDRKNPTWGLGIHAALSDECGPRFAPRGLYRIPLKQPGAFLQFAGGVYVVATDKEITSSANYARINLPGYFLEAEIGANDWFSLVLGAEALPLDIYDTNVVDTESAEPIDSMTITNLWMGAKIGQAPGLGAIVLGTAAVVVLASAWSGWE